MFSDDAGSAAANSVVTGVLKNSHGRDLAWHRPQAGRCRLHRTLVLEHWRHAFCLEDARPGSSHRFRCLTRDDSDEHPNISEQFRSRAHTEPTVGEVLGTAGAGRWRHGPGEVLFRGLSTLREEGTIVSEFKVGDGTTLGDC